MAVDQPIGRAIRWCRIMDAIISFDPMDEFHIWAGRLLVPVDRANASGPFFMIPWNYPGLPDRGQPTIVAAPMEGPYGRNNGAVIWGDISGGKLTYLAGVFDNLDRATSPLFSGRVRLALWDPEPGFWGNASYFGDKDLLSIGVGGQFQKNGAARSGATRTGPRSTSTCSSRRSSAAARSSPARARTTTTTSTTAA